MSPLLHIVLVVIALLFVIFVIVEIRHQKIAIKHSLGWLLLGLIGLIAAIFPGWVIALSSALGFETAANFLAVVCIAFLMVINIQQHVTISKQEQRLKTLTQEISLLKHESEEQNKEER